MAVAGVVHQDSSWDPSENGVYNVCTELTFRRIKKDILAIFKEPPPGIMALPDKDDMLRVHALIMGPADTPYEGGFFYFLVACTSDYPIKPPKVKLLTTGNNTVRFNPNLYRNGKVCLSILGTWSGPSWSPAMNLSSLLISIQSLLNEKPYHNEPGFEQERTPGDVGRYNKIIQHETIRVSVCDVLEKKVPYLDSFLEVIYGSFHDYYEFYTTICKNNMHLDGLPMSDPFGEKRGRFCYKNILDRLQELKTKIPSPESDMSCDEADSQDDQLSTTDL